jgi:hypothetical protein
MEKIKHNNHEIKEVESFRNSGNTTVIRSARKSY